jgi:hypothetical protein
MACLTSFLVLFGCSQAYSLYILSTFSLSAWPSEFAKTISQREDSEAKRRLLKTATTYIVVPAAWSYGLMKRPVYKRVAICALASGSVIASRLICSTR